MKQLFILGVMILVIPFITSAHSEETVNTDEQIVSKEDMVGEGASSMSVHHSTSDSSGEMMGGGMMYMGLLHGLVGVTSLVWLISGAMFLTAQLRQRKMTTTT